MKIAVLIESAAAGSGRHALDLAGALQRDGHSTYLIFNSARSDATFRRRVEELKPKLNGIARVPMRHSPHPDDVRVIATIRRFMRLHGPFDILHCHSTKAGFLGRVGLLRSAGAVVYTPHAPLTMSPRCPAWMRFAVRSLEVALSHRTGAIIAVSGNEAKHLLGLGIAPSRVFVVPNGVRGRGVPEDLGPSRRAALGIVGDEVVVGYVGRLEPQKRVDVLLRAVADSPAEVTGKIRLVIIGSGSLAASLRALSASLGIADRVTWAGEMDQAESCMPAFDLFALTSDYEGFPYVLLEALSAGLPIVTTRVGGATAAVAHDRNGFVVDTGDVAALANAISGLVLDGSLRRRMAEQSKLLSRCFSLDEMVRQTVDVYSKALATASATPSRDASADSFSNSKQVAHDMYH